MKIISPAVSRMGFARRAELFFLIAACPPLLSLRRGGRVSFPRRRLSEPEADQEKAPLCALGVSNERSEWVVDISTQA